MIGLRGKRGALRRRRCIPGEAKLGRENSGGVGWVTNGVKVVGGGATRRGGGPTARTGRAMAGRLVTPWWSVTVSWVSGGVSKAGRARELGGGDTRRVIASMMLYVVAAVTAG